MSFPGTVLNALHLAQLMSKLPYVHYRQRRRGYFLASIRYPELNQFYCPTAKEIEARAFLDRVSSSKRQVTIWLNRHPFSKPFSYKNWQSESFIGMRCSLVGHRKIDPSNPLKWVTVDEEYFDTKLHSAIVQSPQRSLELRQKLYGLSSGDFRHFLGFLEEKPVVSVSVFISNDEAGLYDLTVNRQHRRKRLASDAVLHAIDFAKEHKVKSVTIQTRKSLKPFYGQLGFACIDHFSVIGNSQLTSSRPTH